MFILTINTNPAITLSPNPFERCYLRPIGRINRYHAAGGANGSIMVVVFVCLCLASKKPSEREFFVPTGTDLAVMLFLIDSIN